MDTYVNRREFTRVSVELPGEVASEDFAAIHGQSRDVSLKGIFLVCDTPLPIDSACHIALFLGEQGNQTRIEAEGKVVRVDDAGIGIEFTVITGIDSYDHLRKLVLYNSSGKTEQIEEEFRNHAGLKRRQSLPLASA
jgi:c-di-GMP-binding flagellar brake protein YcgR